ncbi:hypothetical protein [Saccharopolyspora rectivirgula]|jgi:hypothetical protein|uniref:hypothetical protein n=1 Tax=Saccharopolyspora rectivirgula TaxID=28042 RepID=UPI00240A856A|nr:hypothetical protein [Saccharopolyspora rectivirgula]
MKRSLTAAAAVLASGAGVIGWTGAASAATPQLLPGADAVGQTASQLTDQVHSVQQVVGGVVPLQQPTSRDLALPLGDVANVNLGNPGSGLADVLSGKAPLLDLPQMGRSLQDDGAGNAQEQPSVLPAWESTAPEGIPQPDQHGVEVTQHGQDGEDGANGIATAHGTSDQEQLTPQEQQSLVNDVFTQVSEVVPVSRLLS